MAQKGGGRTAQRRAVALVRTHAAVAAAGCSAVGANAAEYAAAEVNPGASVRWSRADRPLALTEAGDVEGDGMSGRERAERGDALCKDESRCAAAGENREASRRERKGG